MAGEFLELMSEGDGKLLGRMTRRLASVIAESFRKDGSRQTDAEVRRRFRILEETCRMLRSEFHWSWVRISDELPAALRARLDGIPWDPSEARAVWSPPGT